MDAGTKIVTTIQTRCLAAAGLFLQFLMLYRSSISELLPYII
jgi:hypothetical protein